jgi:hypothetical protein
MMSLKEPRDFDNGQPVVLNRSNASRSNSKENHHFFPYSLRGDFGVSANDIDSLLNFVFISGRLNREISNDQPPVYYGRYEANNPDILAHLDSHFINDKAVEAAKGSNYQEFLAARGEEIINAIREKTVKAEFDEPEEDIIESNIDFDDEVEEVA